MERGMMGVAKEQSVQQEDPEWVRWQQDILPSTYDQVFYRKRSLLRAVQDAGHRLVELPFGPNCEIGDVLEVGAGSGHHLDFVRHSFRRYVVSDLNDGMLAIARERWRNRSGVVFEKADALALHYPTASFDRVISIYNLEHLPDPHRALKEWCRVVRPGGTLSITIPTEGGIAYNLGRWLTTRRTYRRMGVDYDYVIAREHVNAAYRLISLIRHYFKDRQEHWYPTGIPLTHCNLLYACNCYIPAPHASESGRVMRSLT